VQRILQYFGQDEDLLSLIRELQWPAIESGTSLKALREALERRGIHSVAVSIDRDHEIDWPKPAIVHLSNCGYNHYVVWLPPQPPKLGARLWNGGSSTQFAAANFNSMRSGPVILTSDAPIDDPALVIARRAAIPALGGTGRDRRGGR
jgi:hypothetical protein